MAVKAMKSILKKGALGKAKAKPVHIGKFAALGKAKAVAKAKALAKDKALAKGKALGKAKAKAKAKKLSKSNLAKLGELSLADKIKAAAEMGGEDEEAAAAILKESLTSDENSQVWGRHQTYLNSNPSEKEDYLGKGRKERGMAASLWLMQTAGKKFLSCRTAVGALEKVKKKDEWVSEASMLKVWSEKELSLHLQSGRVIWRQCPSAPGVWEYKDTQKYSRVVSGSRGSTWESGHENEPGAEHLEKFESLYNDEAMGLHDSGFLLGKGKGKSLAKGSLGKSKPNKPRFLALLDGQVDPPNEGKEQPPSEEQILAQTRKQASKAEGMVHKLQGELDQTLEKVKSKLSRKKQTTALGHLAALKKVESQLQASLKKGCLPLSSSTKLLEEAAALAKAAREEKKELSHLEARAPSVASTKKSKK